MTGTDRAQTTFDFAVGITLFLLVVGFAFISVPGLIAPYEGGQESESLLADRTANQLVADELVAPGERYRLERSRVDEFFNASDPAAELGIGDYDVYVTLNSTNSSFTNRSVGDAPRDSAVVSTSRRTVSAPVADGRVRADLTVRVWQ